MILKLFVAAALLGMFATACAMSDDGTTGAAAEAIPEAGSAPLEPQSFSFSLGEPFRIDASQLPPPIGEQPLEGKILLKFLTLTSGLVLKAEMIPIVATGYGGGLTRDTFDPQGVYVAVFYSVTNETDSAMIPGTHINGAFSMIDETGRRWLPADIGSHNFDASAAFALQADEYDPRDWVEAGETVTTAVAFDVSEDATEVRLVSEMLHVELSLRIDKSAVAQVAENASAQPTTTPMPSATALPKVTRAPTLVTKPPAARSGECVGLPYEEQKALLIKISSEHFAGMTAHDPEMARLELPPDARDRRQGGIWVALEFNGDELETTAEKKAALEVQMRNAYEVLYTAGCGDLAQVDISARMTITSPAVDEGGHQSQRHGIAFKTSLKREVADTVDWAAKETVDFNEVWNTLLLNVRWARELRELAEGD